VTAGGPPSWPARSDCGRRARVTGSTDGADRPVQDGPNGGRPPTDSCGLFPWTRRIGTRLPWPHRAGREGVATESAGVGVPDRLASGVPKPISTVGERRSGSFRASAGSRPSRPRSSLFDHRLGTVAGGRRVPGSGKFPPRPSKDDDGAVAEQCAMSQFEYPLGARANANHPAPGAAVMAHLQPRLRRHPAAPRPRVDRAHGTCGQRKSPGRRRTSVCDTRLPLRPGRRPSAWEEEVAITPGLRRPAPSSGYGEGGRIEGALAARADLGRCRG